MAVHDLEDQAAKENLVEACVGEIAYTRGSRIARGINASGAGQNLRRIDCEQVTAVEGA